MIPYRSTNRQAPEVDLGHALLTGLATDRGLYLPCAIPPLGQELLTTARDRSYPDLAMAILAPYTAGTFHRADLEALCHDAYDFEVPIEPAGGNDHILRLDRGPTASFKDFAARFMGRALGRLVQERGRNLLVLTATSGDTGSAIAHAFLGVAGIEVVVLFPIREVSDRQRRQMTTLGGNIQTLALDGTFDDCQALVKAAFADPDLTGLRLTSANSINIGRLLPQSVYYVHAAARVADLAGGQTVVFSVPSGNFGDLMGGLLARHAGLPVARFVVATNANDEVPRFLASGRYEKIVPSRNCISNAMNVGHPSNLARVVDLYGGHMDETGRLLQPPDMARLRADLYGVAVSDAETRSAIERVYRIHRLTLEPHGAVGWFGLERFRDDHPECRDIPAVLLETAHPAKFPDEVAALTGVPPELPPSLRGLEEKAESHQPLATEYAAFKEFLLGHHGPGGRR